MLCFDPQKFKLGIMGSLELLQRSLESLILYCLLGYYLPELNIPLMNAVLRSLSRATSLPPISLHMLLAWSHVEGVDMTLKQLFSGAPTHPSLHQSPVEDQITTKQLIISDCVTFLWQQSVNQIKLCIFSRAQMYEEVISVSEKQN